MSNKLTAINMEIIVQFKTNSQNVEIQNSHRTMQKGLVSHRNAPNAAMDLALQALYEDLGYVNVKTKSIMQVGF
jgi:hypothetical protein